MKKILIFSIIISFATLLHAQGVANKVETPEVRETINKMLADVESAKSKPLPLNRAINTLSDQLLNNWNTKVYVSPDTTRNVTKKLIAVFNGINDEGTNQANKLRIIEAIGFSDNSQEAHDFFLSLMEKGTKKQQEMLLRSLSPIGVRGDDIYQKVKELVIKGTLKEENSFAALQRVDAKKALPEIQRFLSTTKNVEHFVKIGLVLSYYQDPNLLDVLVERQSEFKVEQPKTMQEAMNRMEPADAIGSKDLKKYIEVREGGKVKSALALLRKKGTSGDKDLSFFEKRLSSNVSETREALLDFIQDQVDDGNFSADKVTPVLKRVELNEKNGKIKTRIKNLIDKVNQRKVKEGK